MNSLKRLTEELRPHSRLFAAFLLFSVVASGTFLLIPLGIRSLFIEALEEDRLSMSTGLWMSAIGVLALIGVASYGTLYIMYEISLRVTTRLRARCAVKFMRSTMATHREHNAGGMLEGVTTSLAQIEQFLKLALAPRVMILIIMLGSLIMFFVLSWQLALVAVAGVPLILLGSRVLLQRSRALNTKVNAAAAGVTSSVHQLLENIETVKAFSAERHELEKLNEKQTALLGLQRRSAHLAAIIEPFLVFVFLGAILGVVLVGIRLHASGQVQSGDLVAFLLYALFVIPQVRSLGQFQINLQALDRSFQQIDAIMELPEEEQALREVAVGLDRPVRGAIHFLGVTHHYGERCHALNELSLEIAPCEFVGIVGASGSGKTTLFNLLLRFYRPEKGSIRIDHTDVQRLDVQELRQAIALVPQDILLFNDTILENVRYGSPDAGAEEVHAACRAAHADTFIESLPDRYETHAGARGLKLSGGQRQRIAIARALLKDAPILLMDEPTSSLDAQTEAELRGAMNAGSRGRTTVIIAHRLATVIHLPRILVLERGRIIDDGSHEELLDRCEVYRRLVSSQLVPPAANGIQAGVDARPRLRALT